MWNRLRYSVWAPWYDRVVGAAGFEEARRRSIGHLALVSGARVLIVGAGTGLDLEYLPRGVHVTAVDVTPAMLDRLRRRAQSLDARTDKMRIGLPKKVSNLRIGARLVIDDDVDLALLVNEGVAHLMTTTPQLA